MAIKYLTLVMTALALAAASSGCENVVPATDLPYVNHIVIRGFLMAGQPIDSISISHTLPLSAQYDPNQAAIPDAQVSITEEGRTIPLTYLDFGYFTDLANDTVQSGKTYSINVTWNGLHASATTLIPQPPNILSESIDSIKWDTTIEHYNWYYTDTFIVLEATRTFNIRPLAGEAYSLIDDSIVGLDSGDYEAFRFGLYDYSSLHLASEEDSNGIVHLLERNSLTAKDSNYESIATIRSFDEAYYHFLKTYDRYGDGSDPFGTGGANPKWNVSGDGIGIFIGEAESRMTFMFHR